MIRTWANIPVWTLGRNDQINDCGEAMAANLYNLWNWLSGVDPYAAIESVECQRFYTVLTGWSDEKPGTDNGTQMDVLFRSWCRDGWPSDPLCKPAGYRAITIDEIAGVIERQDAVPCWAQLPAIDDDGRLFGDDVLTAEPGDGHAMLICSADDDGLALITWAKPVRVSFAWWERFGRGQFEVYKVPA